MTDLTSTSLGHEAYQKALDSENMSLIETFTDEGENTYYSAQKRNASARLPNHLGGHL